MTNCKFLDRYCGASRRCNFISGVASSCPATGVQCCSQSPTCVARFKESVIIHRVLKKHHQQRAPLLSNVALNMIVVPQFCFFSSNTCQPFATSFISDSRQVTFQSLCISGHCPRFTAYIQYGYCTSVDCSGAMFTRFARSP